MRRHILQAILEAEGNIRLQTTVHQPFFLERRAGNTIFDAIFHFFIEKFSVFPRPLAIW